MSLIVSLKDTLRPLRDVIFAAGGYAYDFSRFYRYAGWKAHARAAVRDYKAVKIYHRLEKSLSFREQRPGAGAGAARDLVRHLRKSIRAGEPFTFHEKIGLKVLADYVDSAGAATMDPAIVSFRHEYDEEMPLAGGVVPVPSESIRSGRLEDPEAFFLSRTTVRDFAPASVPLPVVQRAVELALKTPSVCNRQAAYVYCLRTRDGIDRALSLQNGNRGFGHEIPCLLVLCADLTAFDTAGERYQHWIDGGMFAMSTVLALHSLGYGTCCLNWSKTPGDDRKLRRLLPIRPEHSVLMMIAVGLPRETIKTCYSARKPVDDVLEVLD